MGLKHGAWASGHAILHTRSSLVSLVLLKVVDVFGCKINHANYVISFVIGNSHPYDRIAKIRQPKEVKITQD